MVLFCVIHREVEEVLRFTDKKIVKLKRENNSFRRLINELIIYYNFTVDDLHSSRISSLSLVKSDEGRDPGFFWPTFVIFVSFSGTTPWMWMKQHNLLVFMSEYNLMQILMTLWIAD